MNKDFQESHDKHAGKPFVQQGVKASHDAIANAADQTELGRAKAFVTEQVAGLNAWLSDPHAKVSDLVDGFKALAEDLPAVTKAIKHGAK